MAGPFLHSGAWVTAVTANDSTKKEELGALRWENGKIYRYVQASAATITQYGAVRFTSTAGNVVALTSAVTTAAPCSVAGIAETALTTSYYGWITVFGVATALVDTSALIQEVLQAGGTAGTLCEPITVGATTVTGVANSNKVAFALTTGVIAGSAVFIHAL